MPEACAVTLDNLVMMPIGYLAEPIATLGPQRMAEVCSALAASVDC